MRPPARTLASAVSLTRSRPISMPDSVPIQHQIVERAIWPPIRNAFALELPRTVPSDSQKVFQHHLRKASGGESVRRNITAVSAGE